MTFPTYRKYKNDKSYFKISSKEELEEIKLMGSYYKVYVLKASILPERVFIGDLLQENNPYCDVIMADDYEMKLEWCKQHLKVL